MNNTAAGAEWSSGPIESSRTIPHQNYDSNIYRNDIGLLKLPITETVFRGLRNVGTIKLPAASDVNRNFVGFTGSASGFGIAENGLMSSVLRTVNLLVVTNQDCISAGFQNYMTDAHLCTRNPSRDLVCQGDGGGPLTATYDGDRKVIGIVTFTVSLKLFQFHF